MAALKLTTFSRLISTMVLSLPKMKVSKFLGLPGLLAPICQLVYQVIMT